MQAFLRIWRLGSVSEKKERERKRIRNFFSGVILLDYNFIFFRLIPWGGPAPLSSLHTPKSGSGLICALSLCSLIFLITYSCLILSFFIYIFRGCRLQTWWKSRCLFIFYENCLQGSIIFFQVVNYCSLPIVVKCRFRSRLAYTATKEKRLLQQLMRRIPFCIAAYLTMEISSCLRYKHQSLSLYIRCKLVFNNISICYQLSLPMKIIHRLHII